MTYTQLDTNTGVMKMYGHISEWWNSADDFARVFEEMEKKFTNIHIRMHCYGGSVFEGTVIFNMIHKSKSTVTIFVEGLAASMGSIILQAAHKRVIADNAFVMIHRPSGYTQGDSETHFNTARMLQAMEKNFTKTYARRSGKTEKDVAKYLDGNDHWLSADEAKEAGMVDEISEPVVATLPQQVKPDNSGDIKSIYSRYAAHLIEGAPVPPSSKTNNHTMKKELIARFNLTEVNENTADDAFVAALGKRFDELGQANQKLVADQVENVIAAAEKVKGQQFDTETRKVLADIGSKTGVSALMVTLGITATAAAPATPATASSAVPAAPATPRVVSLINADAAVPGAVVDKARAAWTWDDYQEKDPEALETMEKTDRPAFVALYKAKYKADPA